MRPYFSKSLLGKHGLLAIAALWTSVILATASSANAQTTQLEINQQRAELQSQVVVSGQLVTLGDLFKNAGDVANKAVFRAPSIGQSGTISASRVVEAARRAGLINISPTEIRTVKVLRDSELITEADILDGVVAQLRTKGYVSGTDRVDVELATRLADQHAVPHSARPFDIRNLRFDRNSGRFTANLSIGGRSDLGTIRIAGRAIETIMTPVMTRNMRRGEIVTESDITLIPMPTRQVLQAKPASMKSVIGMATRQPLRAGAIANIAYFTAPDIIERSDVVTILFQTGNLSLSMRGKSLMSGAMGDVITVQNLQTNRIIRGEIIGAGLLQINKPMNTIAALGAKKQ